VRIIVPVSAGGGVDALARIIGQHYNAVWGQPFIVDNRPGAGGSLGPEMVARATPDGYTLMVSSSSYITNAAIRSVRYDPIADFQPITKLTTNPYLIVVTPSLPVKTVTDLINLAKAKPDTITYASSGTGGVLHLGGELLATLAGIKMTHVPYSVADVHGDLRMVRPVRPANCHPQSSKSFTRKHQPSPNPPSPPRWKPAYRNRRQPDA
jgi:tripartite-type tricarboxylate transporter receptor subunit TctC